MRVKDWMTPGIILIPAETQLMEALRFMNSKAIQRVGVMQGGEIVGVVARFELYEHLEGSCSTLLSRKCVGDALSGTRSTVMSDDSLDRAAQLLVETGRPAIPVMEAGVTAGVITPLDVCRAYRHIFGVRSEEAPRIMMMNASRDRDLLDEIRLRTKASAIQSLLAYPTGREWQIMVRLGAAVPPVAAPGTRFEKCA